MIRKRGRDKIREREESELSEQSERKKGERKS
jgi:hypothetical protein